MSRSGGMYTFVALSLGLGIVAMIACSSSQRPVGGGRVGVPPPQASAGSVDGGLDASADAGEIAIIIRPHWYRPETRNYSQIAEEDFGLTLTDKEKIITDTCPVRPWSMNVPDRPCTKDEECGEGFCNRGHCEPIFTCGQNMGNQCSESRYCRGLCFEGRCRSCVSDEECEKKRDESSPGKRNKNRTTCGSPRADDYYPGRHCLGG